MKEMMSNVTMLVAAVFSITAAAQSGGTMAKGDKMDKMEMRETTYTGCIEAGSAQGTFTLTHLTAGDQMGKDAMKKDTMKKDTMVRDNMSKDAMAPSALALTSSSVNFTQHLGHKVSVTGSATHGKMDAMGKDSTNKSGSPFTVSSLKMVASSCS
jgi:pentapeptide MXKDX repeat protein